MKNLKKFETAADYEAAESGLILPNVSLVTENNTVHYNKFDPYAGHDYVDLGLPSGTLWATMNVGANSITDYGNYYQYGKGADQYAATSGESKYSGMEDPLATSVDTAVQVWGGNWHMPTMTQFEELTANTTSSWEIDYQGSGKNGYAFTANGQTVFFPATGNYLNGKQQNVGNSGYYWSSTPYDSSNAYKLLFYGGYDGMSWGDRIYGNTVRPVVG